MPHLSWGPIFLLVLLQQIFSTSTLVSLACVYPPESNIGLLWWYYWLVFSGRGRSSYNVFWQVQPWCLLGCISPLYTYLLLILDQLIRSIIPRHLCTNTLSFRVISLEIFQYSEPYKRTVLIFEFKSLILVFKEMHSRGSPQRFQWRKGGPSLFNAREEISISPTMFSSMMLPKWVNVLTTVSTHSWICQTSDEWRTEATKILRKWRKKKLTKMKHDYDKEVKKANKIKKKLTKLPMSSNQESDSSQEMSSIVQD